ncbi:MAG: B12-binding domain-containing radical SAM protein [Desulfobacterales bacterium]|nr:B12-binding domain-containing radical SAM protein [Desulfobacterales bacterium]
MNILLIEINPFIPPSTPISIAYIAAFLRWHGFHVNIMNIGENTPFSLHLLSSYICDFKPGLVGFSTYQRNILSVIGLANYIKSSDPKIKIAIGGPQATFMPSSALQPMGSIDYICREEGETALLNIALAIRDGIDNTVISGSSCKCEDGLFYDGPSVEAYSDLDRYPSPYLHNDLIDFSNLEEAILFTSRGCPYGCVFCYTPNAFKRKVRFHSIERVIEEIEWIYRKGIKKFWFADPSFSINIDRIDRLMEEVLRKNLKIHIWLETRADLVNNELVKKMKAAGVYLVAYGLESASKKVLEGLKKNISLNDMRRAIKLTQKNGIDVELFTQYGLPHENFGDAMKTLQFLKDNDVKIRGNSNSQQMQVYFGTDVFNSCQEYGVRPLERDMPAYMSIGRQYETEYLSSDDLKKIRLIWEKESLDGVKRKVS